MARRIVVVLVVLSFLTATAAFATGAREKSEAADRAAIEALWNEYARSAAEADVDAFLAIHDQDAYKMPQDQQMFQLWKIETQFRSQRLAKAEAYKTQMRVEPTEIVIMGDYAYTMGTYYKTDTPKSGGTPIVTDGKFLTVLIKGEDGTWRILRDCYNSNVPPV